MSHRINIPILNKISIVIFAGVVIFGIYRIMNIGSRTEHNRDPIDLRNTNIISLRMPDSIALSQRVAIYEEGYAARFFVPTNEKSNITEVPLDSNEMKRLQLLRQEWCENDLFPNKILGSDKYYDVAMDCNGKDIKQRKVPIELLPQVLAEIVQRLPSVPTPTP